MGERESTFDFLVGFLLGALAGAAAALLLAPAPGRETREQLKEKAIELRERAKNLELEAERLEELKARAQQLLEEQRERFREAIEEGKIAAARRKEELMAQFGAREIKEEPPIDLTPDSTPSNG